MLRHIISVSLAMAACVTLIPTKANAVSLKLTPVDGLQRNTGESIAFDLELNPNTPTSSGGSVRLLDILIDFYDRDELSNPQIVNKISFDRAVDTTKIIARFVFKVEKPVKDNNNDVRARVDYRTGNSSLPIVDRTAMGGDVQPVPEPLTIFGTATALGCGVLFKRKSSKKTVS